MGDKAKAPRIKEQYKDNAVAVEKNAEAKAEIRKHRTQEKMVEIREREESAECR